MVFRIISRILLITAFALAATSLVGLIYSESVFPFLISSALTFVLSGCIFLLTRKKNGNSTMQRREAFLTVTLAWIFMSFLGCLPYLFSHSIPSIVDAYFESVSGFTTTGASILTDIEVLPKSILFWRSLTHWIGGIGIIVLVIVIMPTLQIGGYHLFSLESSLQEKIRPKTKEVGIRLLIIYLSLTGMEILLLLLGGMNLFESICHSFGTIATGGFSPKNTSIIDYSPYIQYVIMLFMLLSGVNFMIHYAAFKRNFNKVKYNEEFRFYLFVILTIGSIISLTLFFKMHKPLEESFREGFFQVISIITCTGFASADYLQWPVFAYMIIFLCMFLGGSTGSTAGGIKMARHLILFKNISAVIRQSIKPNAVLPIKLNKKTLKDETNKSIMSFIALYFLIFLAGSFSLLLTGLDVATSSSAVATCMAGIGPGIGTVGPVSNFAHLSTVAKIILPVLMLLGRLEIYTMLIIFTPGFWKK